jgi:lysophospholipase L1-like esterase
VSRARKLTQNLLLGIAATALVLIASELILRVVLREPVRAFPAGIVARTKTSEYDVKIATNRGGFRDVEHPRGKRNGTRRVAVLGDSFVVGSGVAFDDVFTSRLRDLLSAHGLDVEVLNFGVSGTGPVHSLRLWRRVAQSYQPDIVLVCLYAGNDAGDALREASEKPARPALFEAARRARARIGRKSASPPARAASADSAADWNAFGARNPATLEALLESARARGIPEESVRSRLHAIPDSLVADALAFRSNPFNVAEAVLDPTSLRDNLLLDTEEANRGWNQVERALRELRTETERAGAKLVLVCIPAGPQVDARYWWATNLGLSIDERVLTETAFQDRLAHFAAGEGIPLVDLLPAMRAHPDEALYYERDGHWNARGHEVAASVIAERLAAIAGRP